MIWFVLGAVVLIVGASVLAGKMIESRSNPPREGGSRRMTRQQKLNAAKVAGVFPGRKESH